MTSYEFWRAQYERKVLMWYATKLAEEFVGRVLTPAVKHLVEMRLYHLQQTQQAREPDPIWRRPVVAVFDAATNSFSVEFQRQE